MGERGLTDERTNERTSERWTSEGERTPRLSLRRGFVSAGSSAAKQGGATRILHIRP